MANPLAQLTQNLPKIAIALILIGGGAVFVSKLSGGGANGAGTQVVNVTVPTLTTKARRGAIAFKENCAVCHGENGAGTDQGPPMVHTVYNPGHHGDESIFRAVKNGVKQHHWPFGNMPPQPQVNQTMAVNIAAYIREVQAANGIVFREHRM
ncbi:MAG: c-type cytochrome [Magnetovibrio sp.]|nr:c-type cytochrome [Magnetovibrio sp.]